MLDQAHSSERETVDHSAPASLQIDNVELLLTRIELHQKNLRLKQARAELEQTHTDRVRAGKLASLGQLSAGVAHEINTPVKFVEDNLRTCAESFNSLRRLVEAYQALLLEVELEGVCRERTLRVRRLEAEVDAGFLLADIPLALSQSADGIERVRTIVHALQDFVAMGESDDKVAYDVNANLRSTLVVAHNQLKNVADLKTDFGPVPLVDGRPGELNQVMLNLLVNAAHAIQERGTNARGQITVRTRFQDGAVVISVADNGCGIADSLKSRIFEPFFTTKRAGRGQGLAISRNIVEERHGGRIWVESQTGVGSTFYVSLPVPEQTRAA